MMIIQVFLCIQWQFVILGVLNFDLNVGEQPEGQKMGACRMDWH